LVSLTARDELHVKTPDARRPGSWKQYARAFGMIGLPGLAVLTSTALTRFATGKHA